MLDSFYIMPAERANRTLNDLARYLGEQGQELEPLAQLVSIDRLGNYVLVICDDPANLMGAAVAPQDAAYRPDVGLRTTMRAGTNGRPAFEGKWNHIVWYPGHALH